jgi:hypothetical protein
LHSHVRDNNLVQHNILKNCNGASIRVRGNNAAVSDNSILGGQRGIDIGKFEKCDTTGNLTRFLQDGDNPTVTGNTAIGCSDDCINVYCNDKAQNDDDDDGVGVCTAGRVADNFIDGSADDDDVRVRIVCATMQLERLTDLSGYLH